MSKQGSDKVAASPLKAAIFLILVWAAATNIMFFVLDKVVMIPFLYMMCFGFAYPVYTAVICFRYAKRYGLIWYFFGAMIIITVAEFCLVPGFSNITPNIILVTVLCEVFCGGIGNVFADKAAIDAAKAERRRKKSGEDKDYKNILDD